MLKPPSTSGINFNPIDSPPATTRDNTIMRIFFLIFLITISSKSIAIVNCYGKVHSVYKWHGMTTLSARLKTIDGAITRWISLPNKSDEAMVLLALGANKDIEVYWASDDVIKCTDGWTHNTPLNGYIAVSN